MLKPPEVLGHIDQGTDITSDSVAAAPCLLKKTADAPRHTETVFLGNARKHDQKLTGAVPGI